MPSVIQYDGFWQKVTYSNSTSEDVHYSALLDYGITLETISETEAQLTIFTEDRGFANMAFEFDFETHAYFDEYWRNDYSVKLTFHDKICTVTQTEIDLSAANRYEINMTASKNETVAVHDLSELISEVELVFRVSEEPWCGEIRHTVNSTVAGQDALGSLSVQNETMLELAPGQSDVVGVYWDNVLRFEYVNDTSLALEVPIYVTIEEQVKNLGLISEIAEQLLGAGDETEEVLEPEAVESSELVEDSEQVDLAVEKVETEEESSEKAKEEKEEKATVKPSDVTEKAVSQTLEERGVDAFFVDIEKF